MKYKVSETLKELRAFVRGFLGHIGRTCSLGPTTLLILILAFTAWLGECLPGSFLNAVRDGMIFDIDRIIAGEIWRLILGQCVHVGHAFFFEDIAVFCLIGLFYERKMGLRYPVAFIVSAVFIGVLILCYHPRMSTYYGLSGISHGLFTLVLAHEWRMVKGKGAPWLRIMTLIFGAKIAFEGLSGLPWLPANLPNTIVSMTDAHLWGALAGFGVYSVFELRREAGTQSPTG